MWKSTTQTTIVTGVMMTRLLTFCYHFAIMNLVNTRTIKSLLEKGEQKMESIKSFFKDSEARAKVFYAVRQTIGQAVLSAGAIGFLVDHLEVLKGHTAILAAAGVVGLILYFSNKK